MSKYLIFRKAFLQWFLFVLLSPWTAQYNEIVLKTWIIIKFLVIVCYCTCAVYWHALYTSVVRRRILSNLAAAAFSCVGNHFCAPLTLVSLEFTEHRNFYCWHYSEVGDFFRILIVRKTCISNSPVYNNKIRSTTMSTDVQWPQIVDTVHGRVYFHLLTSKKCNSVLWSFIMQLI